MNEYIFKYEKKLNYMVYYNYFIQVYIENQLIFKILIDKIN